MIFQKSTSSTANNLRIFTKDFAAFTEDNLFHSNSIQHHGALLTEDEELTPTLENVIVNLNPCDCTGNPTSVGPRRRWKRFFEFFLEAKGITKDTQKHALLLHCAGQDVQDIFVTLSDTGPALDEEMHYAKAMRLLDARFTTS